MLGNIFVFSFLLLSIQSTSTLLCYECDSCTDISLCACNTSVNYDIRTSYCVLQRESVLNGINFYIKHFPRNATRYYIYDPHYISVEETISYNNVSERWSTNSNKIAFACQTDECNRADLLNKLPSTGLSLMLPSGWLNDNFLRKASKNTTLCRECPEERICSDSTSFINTSKCNEKECQGSCIMDETFDQAETTQLCYQSFCSDDTSIGPDLLVPEIKITAFYYINTKRFEVIEIAIICNGNTCARFELFTDIKEKLLKDLNAINPFLPNRGNSIYSASFIFLIMLLNFY